MAERHLFGAILSLLCFAGGIAWTLSSVAGPGVWIVIELWGLAAVSTATAIGMFVGAILLAEDTGESGGGSTAAD